MIPLILFIVTLAIGVPTFVVIGLTAFISVGPLPHSVLVDQMVAALNNFPLIALPLFLLMGNLMTYGGITTSLVSFTNLFLGGSGADFRWGLWDLPHSSPPYLALRRPIRQRLVPF
jgi:C4-dicarboxylate transporter DctM subunit